MTLLVAGSLVPLDLTVKVYISRHANASGVTSEDLNYLLPHRDGQIFAKRPTIAALIEDAMYDARDRDCQYGLALGICGPPSVVRSVKSSVGGLDVNVMKQVGGVSMRKLFLYNLITFY